MGQDEYSFNEEVEQKAVILGRHFKDSITAITIGKYILFS